MRISCLLLLPFALGSHDRPVTTETVAKAVDKMWGLSLDLINDFNVQVYDGSTNVHACDALHHMRRVNDLYIEVIRRLIALEEGET